MRIVRVIILICTLIIAGCETPIKNVRFKGVSIKTYADQPQFDEYYLFVNFEIGSERGQLKPDLYDPDR